MTKGHVGGNCLRCLCEVSGLTFTLEGAQQLPVVGGNYMRKMLYWNYLGKGHCHRKMAKAQGTKTIAVGGTVEWVTSKACFGSLFGFGINADF